MHDVLIPRMHAFMQVPNALLHYVAQPGLPHALHQCLYVTQLRLDKVKLTSVKTSESLLPNMHCMSTDCCCTLACSLLENDDHFCILRPRADCSSRLLHRQAACDKH